VSNQYGSMTSSNALLTVLPFVTCLEPRPGLLSWWPAEANASDRYGTDHGMLVGNTTFGAGYIGQAFVFDGDGDGITVGNPSYNPLGALTIELWLKRSSAVKSSQSGGKGYLFGIRDGIDGLAMFDNGQLFWQNGCCSLSGGGINDTNWHHVAVTVTTGATTIYLDGQSTGGLAPQDLYFTNATIGARAGTNSSFYGALDEVAFYNRVLSKAEIQLNYLAGVGGKCWMPEPPYILVPPASQTVPLGGNVAFSVLADGRPKTLSYQWSLNGANITGATNASLSLTNLLLSKAGNYGVTITNLHGYAYGSAMLIVQVTNPPILSSITYPGDGTLQGFVSGYSGPIAIQASTNLYDWTTITNFVLSNSPISFRDDAASNFIYRFYRTKLE